MILKRSAQLLSLLALAGAIAPSCLLLAGRLTLAEMQHYMLAATLLWFVSAPFWMEHRTN
jgi:hypothetical protein